MHLTVLKLETFALEIHGQWLRRSGVNWKDAVKPVSKFKFRLIELVDQINQKLINQINVLKNQVTYLLSCFI